MSDWKDSIMTHTEMCDEIDSLRARLADEQANAARHQANYDGLLVLWKDEQAKRVAAEAKVATFEQLARQGTEAAASTGDGSEK